MVSPQVLLRPNFICNLCPDTTARKCSNNCIIREGERERWRERKRKRQVNSDHKCELLGCCVCVLWSIIKIQPPLIHCCLICKWIELPSQAVLTNSAWHGVIIAFPCTCPVNQLSLFGCYVSVSHIVDTGNYTSYVLPFVPREHMEIYLFVQLP